MPKRIDFPRHLINYTPATIRKAFAGASTIVNETGNQGSINITSILTRIIQDAGRFCERYASDILYEIKNLQTLCDMYDLEEPIDEIITFGLRENGSDHNAYIMNQLANSRQGSPYASATPYYRRVLAVHCRVYRDPDYSTPCVECELRDITHKFLTIDPADIDDNGQVNPGPYPSSHGMPDNIAED